MDLVLMSTFNDQSMSIGCVGKLGHLFGFLRHYLLSIYFVLFYISAKSSNIFYICNNISHIFSKIADFGISDNI